MKARLQPSETWPHGFLARTVAIPVLPANIAGAVLVYVFFNYIDPIAAARPAVALQELVAITVASVLIGLNFFLAFRWLLPVGRWHARLLDGADPAEVPDEIRRRVLNAPLISATLTMSAWVLAGTFYFPYLVWVVGVPASEGLRGFLALVFVAGPVTAALAFLISEFFQRRQVPLFFPDGQLGASGFLRVPVVVRLAATFFVTAVYPLVLMLIVDVGLEFRFGQTLPADVRPLWLGLVRTQTFIVVVAVSASVVMAILVARFINRPVQRLREGMSEVAAGNLDVQVPVRSADELGELIGRFNQMVVDLRRGARANEMFGRYVSPVVARWALDRGIALGGEVVRATAMFVDLRGFTAMTARTPAPRVVEILNEYYELVEGVCEQEGGVITQFLGDGVVAVFGGPLSPTRDHALRAVRAAIALQRALGSRDESHTHEHLAAGIGLCTGDMIAGNVGSGGRVAYTIVGDAVNQASRLQVKTRDLEEPILATESTIRALGDGNGIGYRACGAVALKGIAAPVPVYAIGL